MSRNEALAKLTQPDGPLASEEDKVKQMLPAFRKEKAKEEKKMIETKKPETKTEPLSTPTVPPLVIARCPLGHVVEGVEIALEKFYERPGFADPNCMSHNASIRAAERVVLTLTCSKCEERFGQRGEWRAIIGEMKEASIGPSVHPANWRPTD